MKQHIFCIKIYCGGLLWKNFLKHNYPGCSMSTRGYVFTCPAILSYSPWAPFQEAHGLEELGKETDPFQTPLVMEGSESQSWHGAGLRSPRKTRATSELNLPIQAHAPYSGLLSWSMDISHWPFFSAPLPEENFPGHSRVLLLLASPTF